VTFSTDFEALRSYWVVLGASDIAAGPVAMVELPFPVPCGLHGNWFSASTITIGQDHLDPQSAGPELRAVSP
jgi:Retinal pigment epithelial membrane protein